MNSELLPDLRGAWSVSKRKADLYGPRKKTAKPYPHAPIDFAKHGCTREDFRIINDDPTNWIRNKSPHRLFLTQQNGAKKRGIGWRFNFYDWWRVWERSGKWLQRGAHKGQYCMARHGDVGPYAEGNVYITTCGNNCIDGYAARAGGKIAKAKARATAMAEALEIAEYLQPANGNRLKELLKLL